MDQTALYFHVLTLLPHIGPRRILRIFCCVQNLSSFLQSPELFLRKAKVSHSYIDTILQKLRTINPDEEVALLKKHNIQTITCFDPDFPDLLLETPDYPVLLYYKGTFPDETALPLAIIGSRRCTPYGKKVVRALVSGLAPHKPVIISGLAFGIDAEAHKAAVTLHVPTVGVLGSGICSIHPKSNEALATSIIDEDGCVMSEFPPFEQARPEYFPRRNRIVAGLSKGIVVIEAAQKSGALITAEIGLSYNRDVFAVPGSIFSSVSKGCNNLLSEGAHIVRSANDIAEIYGLDLAEPPVHRSNNSIEKQIISFLQNNTHTSLSDLQNSLDTPIEQLMTAVTSLEINGVIAQDQQGLLFIA